jgi:hypothetical protein
MSSPSQGVVSLLTRIMHHMPRFCMPDPHAYCTRRATRGRFGLAPKKFATQEMLGQVPFRRPTALVQLPLQRFNARSIDSENQLSAAASACSASSQRAPIGPRRQRLPYAIKCWLRPLVDTSVALIGEIQMLMLAQASAIVDPLQTEGTHSGPEPCRQDRANAHLKCCRTRFVQTA